MHLATERTGCDTPHVHLDHARRLDRLADMELQHGHIMQAERLAHAADELRRVAA